MNDQPSQKVHHVMGNYMWCEEWDEDVWLDKLEEEYDNECPWCGETVEVPDSE